MEPSLVDEIDCGNLFDQIDDLIEFPPESECGGGGVGNFVSGGDGNDFPSMWSDPFPESDPFLDLSVPYEDIMQLEWLSNFVEDSFSGGGMTIGKESLCKEPSHNQFQTSSPVSGLESSNSSSSSCSEGKTSESLSPSHGSAQRVRSKRPRPPTFNPRVAIELISPPPEPPPLLKKAPRPAGTEQKKKKKKKIKITEEDSREEIRKCTHCEITKTPQWRAGPMGPKSLCNACGVRYKSGRLFPEYRPAASPTFVPSLHSNSHKKVAEMRNKAIATPTTTEPQHTPNP